MMSYKNENIPVLVMISQMLWTAGHSLTSGMFLSFFLNHLMGNAYSDLAVSLLLATPDIMGIGGGLATQWSLLTGSRKTGWLTATFFSRGLFVIVPFLSFVPHYDIIIYQLNLSCSLPVTMMLMLVGCSWFFQNIAYVNLVTWISELYPETRWNNLFGKWELARTAILILFPITGAMLKHLGKHLDQYQIPNLTEQIFYIIIFLSGCSLQIFSTLPMIKLPATKMQGDSQKQYGSLFHDLGEVFSSKSRRCLILGSWWLAFFQGLTQAVFYYQLTKVIGAPLELAITLNTLQYLVQTSLGFPTIFAMNRYGPKKIYGYSLLIVSIATLCWFFTHQGTFLLLTAAYLIYAFFAPVNIAGTTLICKISHHQHQALSFAMFRTVSGLFAGVAGILGGFLFSSVLPGYSSSLGLTPFQIMVIISFLGRVTAPLWVIFVEEPASVNVNERNQI